jgi:hypothetical protein
MTYAAVALAIALVCLLGGFLWGRSNVRTQVEEAVEKEHVALDAREFAMRQQLEDSVAEIARLRPLAEELGQVQKRLKREQAEYARMKAEFNATMRGGAPNASVEEESVQTPEPAPIPDSADLAIQKLLHSLEAFNEPVSKPSLTEKNENVEPVLPKVPQPSSAPAPVQMAESRVPTQLPPTPAPPLSNPPHPATPKPEPLSNAPSVSKPQPVAKPEPAIQPQTSVKPQPVKAAPPESRKPAPAEAGKTVDEWQEFARQLDALTGRKK